MKQEDHRRITKQLRDDLKRLQAERALLEDRMTTFYGEMSAKLREVEIQAPVSPDADPVLDNLIFEARGLLENYVQGSPKVTS